MTLFVVWHLELSALRALIRQATLVALGELLNTLSTSHGIYHTQCHASTIARCLLDGILKFRSAKVQKCSSLQSHTRSHEKGCMHVTSEP